MLPTGDLTHRILSTRPDALCAYWAMDETSGSVAKDQGTHGCNGAYHNCQLNQPGPGDGKPSVGFDPRQGSFLDCFSPTLASLWSGDQGTIIYRARMGADWNNDKSRRAVWAGHDLNNHVSLRKENVHFLMRFGHETTGEMELQYYYMVTLDWFVGTLTWDLAGQSVTSYLSLDQQTYYKTVRTGGVQRMDSPLAYFRIGNRPVQWFPDPETWAGWLARVACWNAPLTEPEIANLIPIV